MDDHCDHWKDLGDALQLRRAAPHEVAVGGEVIALFFVDETWYALDGLCAHQGGPIASGELTAGDHGTCVTCPWHGWQYELSTGIQTVNRQPLQRTFSVREREGRLEVLLGGSREG
ncbi:MAG: Rieske (2Fe-2S) protein [Planctomycetota bacterium]